MGRGGRIPSRANRMAFPSESPTQIGRISRFFSSLKITIWASELVSAKTPWTLNRIVTISYSLCVVFPKILRPQVVEPSVQLCRTVFSDDLFRCKNRHFGPQGERHRITRS